jgi:hypothetical protein
MKMLLEGWDGKFGMVHMELLLHGGVLERI